MQQFFLTILLATAATCFGYDNCSIENDTDSNSPFSAVFISLKDNSTTITWFTNDCDLPNHFTVQASMDSIEWKNRAVVFPGEVATNHYFFEDKKEGKNFLYYRIVRYSSDGDIETSKNILVNQDMNNSRIILKVTGSKLNFSTKTAMESPQLMLWKPDGGLLFKQEFQGSFNQLKVPVDAKFSGMVVVHINEQSGRSILEKIIL